jgi:hypothetical protein
MPDGVQGEDRPVDDQNERGRQLRRPHSIQVRSPHSHWNMRIVLPVLVSSNLSRNSVCLPHFEQSGTAKDGSVC